MWYQFTFDIADFRNSISKVGEVYFISGLLVNIQIVTGLISNKSFS